MTVTKSSAKSTGSRRSGEYQTLLTAQFTTVHDAEIRLHFGSIEQESEADGKISIPIHKIMIYISKYYIDEQIQQRHDVNSMIGFILFVNLVDALFVAYISSDPIKSFETYKYPKTTYNVQFYWVCSWITGTLLFCVAIYYIIIFQHKYSYYCDSHKSCCNVDGIVIKMSVISLCVTLVLCMLIIFSYMASPSDGSSARQSAKERQEKIEAEKAETKNRSNNIAVLCDYQSVIINPEPHHGHLIMIWKQLKYDVFYGFFSFERFD